MRNIRRRYKRGYGSSAGRWFLVCCVILAMVVAVKVCVPDVKERVQSAMTPVYERSEEYKVVFARFGEALSGDQSFTDAFTDILNLARRG